MPDDQSPTDILIGVADGYVGRLPEVVDRLRSAGLAVAQVLADIHVVTGSIAADKVASLRRIEGVASVEPSRTFQLPPPDERVQ
ncbi:MAG TPA: hypothetical protein VNA89_11980 [Gemmatimonadaceae bacterium]|nr:hypothetical protein [Gemmatimonadaceae bacterium]